MQDYFLEYMKRANHSLLQTEFTSDEGVNLGPIEGLRFWRSLTEEVANKKKSIYFIGNGASAAMASHMSADACKNGKLKARCLTDGALVTAISNDVEYRQVFSLQLERYSEPGDLLTTISSSGNSPNIVAAIKKGKELGLKVVTVSGMKPDNASRQLGDLNIYLPADRYGIVESGHQTILHCWLDDYLNSIGIDI